MDTTKQLDKILIYTKLNPKSFSEKLGLSRPQAIYDIQKGKTKNFSQAMINKIISVFPEFNKSWLLTGEGEMLKEPETPKYREAKEVDPNYMEVPLIGIKAQAGYLNEYNDTAFIEELPTVKVQVDRTFHGKYRCFEVSGDSMNDGTFRSICEGDVILGREVKKELWCYKLHFNQWFFVINHVNGLLIKQIVAHNVEEGTITCHSLNPIYGEDFTLSLNEVKELYNVIKITERILRF